MSTPGITAFLLPRISLSCRREPTRQVRSRSRARRLGVRAATKGAAYCCSCCVRNHDTTDSRIDVSLVNYLLLKPTTERRENVFFTCLPARRFRARRVGDRGTCYYHTTCYNRRCRHCLLDDRARQVRQLGGPRAALPTRERRPPASPRGGAHEHALQLAARVPHVGLLAGAAVPRQGARRGDRAGEGGQMRRAAHDLRHDPQKCQGHW